MDLPAPPRTRLDGPQSLSGRFGEGNNPLLPPGLEPRIVQPVALSRHHVLTQTTNKLQSQQVQQVAYLGFFMRRERVTAMAVPNRSYGLKKQLLFNFLLFCSKI